MIDDVRDKVEEMPSVVWVGWCQRCQLVKSVELDAHRAQDCPGCKGLLRIAPYRRPRP